MARVTEHERVTAHLTRARIAGTIASLSFPDWERTVADFYGLCAYCQQEPFSVLEHFLPVEVAGTHVNNCVPACLSCNKRKSNYQGDELIKRLGQDTVDRIQSYLASRVATQEPSVRVRAKPSPQVKRQSPPPDAPYWTCEQVRNALGISPSTLLHYRKRYHITVHKFVLDPRGYIATEDVERIQALKAQPWKYRKGKEQ